MNFLVHISQESQASFLLCIYLEWDSGVVRQLCIQLQYIMPNSFLGVIQTQTLTSNVGEFQLLDILTNNDLYHRALNVPILTDEQHILMGSIIVGLMCISLRSNDVEYLFICLLAICRSSFVRCLFKSFAHFLFRCLSFSYLICNLPFLGACGWISW